MSVATPANLVGGLQTFGWACNQQGNQPPGFGLCPSGFGSHPRRHYCIAAAFIIYCLYFPLAAQHRPVCKASGVKVITHALQYLCYLRGHTGQGHSTCLAGTQQSFQKRSNCLMQLVLDPTSKHFRQKNSNFDIFHPQTENCTSSMFKTGAWVNQSLTELSKSNAGLMTGYQASANQHSLGWRYRHLTGKLMTMIDSQGKN